MNSREVLKPVANTLASRKKCNNTPSPSNQLRRDGNWIDLETLTLEKVAELVAKHKEEHKEFWAEYNDRLNADDWSGLLDIDNQTIDGERSLAYHRVSSLASRTCREQAQQVSPEHIRLASEKIAELIAQHKEENKEFWEEYYRQINADDWSDLFEEWDKRKSQPDKTTTLIPCALDVARGWLTKVCVSSLDFVTAVFGNYTESDDWDYALLADC